MSTVTTSDRTVVRRGEFILESTERYHALLRPTDLVARALALEVLADAGSRVELAKPHGHSAFVAVATVLRWSPATRLLVVTNPERLEQRELRKAHRVPVAVPVTIASHGATSAECRGHTRDLSLTGLAAIVEGELPLWESGTAIAVTLALPGGDLVADGTVVAVAEPHRQGSLIRAALRLKSVDDDRRFGRYLARVEWECVGAATA